MTTEEYLSILNTEQLEAVLHKGSSLLILAGAGSGKTRVITTKIAYMIRELGYAAHSILAVTFTKKAAKEMKDRASLLEPSAVHSQIRTFHSFGSWFLRKYYQEARLDKNFTVYDDDDMASLVLKAVPDLTGVQAKVVAHKISLAKDYCLSFDDDLSKIDNDPEFPELYKKYQMRLESTGNADFGDLIMKSVIVLKNNEKIREHMHSLFKTIMVDEYQDSNVAQFEFLRMLKGPKCYLCVVGDDDQSIYKFRGAEIENILNFQDVFEGTHVIKLEKNYRSVPSVLSLANSVIKNNTKRLGKILQPVRKEDSKAVLKFFLKAEDEIEDICSLIEDAYEQGVPYSDWAILYRMNAQSLGFESAFLRKKIPYSVVGSLKFYQREEIKDALSFLSFIANPKDELSFRRIINKPARGIGLKSQDDIVKLYLQNRSESDFSYNLLDACIDYAATKKEKAKISLLNFSDTINYFLTMLEQEKTDDSDKKSSLSVFIEQITEKSGFKEYYEAQDEIANTQKINNLNELANSAFPYPLNREGLTEFLDHIELDRMSEIQNEENEDTDKVTLITIHNTKGLEFSRVILTGMEEGVFPRQDKSEEELEEERRLFYVGITRAKDKLFFTSCDYRVLYGKYNNMEPSKFLFELDRKFLKIEGKQPFVFKNTVGNAVKGEYAKAIACRNALENRWCKGTKLFHDDYGYGYIIGSESSDEYLINVQFESGHVKKFLPRYQASKLLIVKD
ncbi:MAG: ATP-dependent helicase [Treponemataceae bacterium]